MIWLVLLSSLPSGGSSTSRVTLWRRLKRLGALALPGGGAVLPDRPEQRESFQWLLQELQQAGGEAVLLHVQQLDGVPLSVLQDRFNVARAEEYAELAGTLSDLQRQVETPEHLSKAYGLLERLRKRYTDVQRIDFFQSPAGVQLGQTLADLERQLRGEPMNPVLPVLDAAQYRGRIWSTRPFPKVDRLASGWLIRRFIDPQATLAYTDTPGLDDVSFDRAEGEFTHVGPLCTFEVLLRAFGLNEPGLSALGDIVHELDLQDGMNARPETPGVDALLRGLFAARLPDHELEAHAHPLFDHLYRALSAEVSRDPAD